MGAPQPGSTTEIIEDTDLEVEPWSYAAAARAMLTRIRERTAVAA